MASGSKMFLILKENGIPTLSILFTYMKVTDNLDSEVDSRKYGESRCRPYIRKL